MYNFVHKVNINLSRFDGENNQDGIRWINKIEKYSEMCNIYGDNEKLSVLEMYMDKTTTDWFLWWDSTMKGGSLARDCNTFKKKKFKRFEDMEEINLYNKLSRLQ